MTASYTQCNPDEPEVPEGGFCENFDESTLKYFDPVLKRNGETGKRYSHGIDSPSEVGTKIMMIRIDPDDRAGPEHGSEIVSKSVTHFGAYAVRLKLPDVVNTQPNVGAVVGCYTYQLISATERSEIDIEWLLADPKFIYIGAWTGSIAYDKMQGICRIINLATGKIYSTTYRTGINGARHPLTGKQNQPEKIQPVENYNAAAQFYTYGFDWHERSITWWIEDPTSKAKKKIVLWKYEGSTPVQNFTGIPQNPVHYALNFWHTNNWPVETNQNSVEKPFEHYGVEIDWMSYTPFSK